MVKTGVPVSQEAVDAYLALKSDRKYKWITLKFAADYKSIELDQTGLANSSFADLQKALPDASVRYFAYDCNYTLRDGQERKKVLIGSYSSDDHAPGREKMLVSGSVNTIKAHLKEAARFAEIHERDDLTEENFINIVSENRTK